MIQNKNRKNAGKPVQLAQLYEQYCGLMFSIARRMLGAQWDAEDAVHDSLLKLEERLSCITEVDSPATRSYVALTVKRVCIDLLRRKKPKTEPSAEAEVPAAEESRMALTWCMEQLSDEERELLLLRYYYGYSVRELAKQLRLSEAAVRKREQRAKRRLQKLCEEAEIL